MDNLPYNEADKEIKEALQSNDTASAAAKIKEYLEKENKILLNIAITGESGSGKSTFVNAFRGIDSRDEGAAPTGSVETTKEATPYPHLSYPNVTLWDLPGIGTTKFPAKKYLKLVGFEKFDFFIIISADRFRENDVKLALEIKKMGKSFYFVRSKIDNNLRAEEKSQRDFNTEKTLEVIRQNCVQGLEEQGVKSPKVFLISSFELHLYDFQLLVETWERELPSHKTIALLLAAPTVNPTMFNKKKKALQSRIKYYASLSALVASVPLPGLSISVDVGILVTAIIHFKRGFGLDDVSLKKLSYRTNTPLNELQAVMTSPFAAEVTKELMTKFLTVSATQIVLLAAEEGTRFIPILGIPLSMTFSFVSTYQILKSCFNMVTEDAQNVQKKALGMNT